MGNVADRQPSTEGPVPPSSAATGSDIGMDLTVAPALTAALAASGAPVVSRLVLTTTTTVAGATLRFAVQDADGPVGAPAERTVDLQAGTATVVEDVRLGPDPAAMLAVAAPSLAWVRVQLEAGGALLAERRVPVHLLPAAQWAPTPLPLALALLAAHVQPDDPAVTALLAEAAQLLQEGTDSPSMPGYAEGAERVDEVVEAITWAMRRRGIRAEEPPAGRVDAGQLVRTPTEVLDGGAGTGLDTTVTLAAACERAGLRPLLWVVEGHAFLGYWREDRGAEHAATTDVEALVAEVEAGAIGLVETRLLTDRGNTSADLHGPAYRAWLTGDRARVLGVSDVTRSREAGVQPLPPRTSAPVVEPEPAPAPEPVVAEVPAEPEPEPAPVSPPPARVQQWQAALLDLSVRNRLINYTERSGVPLTAPGRVLAVLEDLVATGSALTLLPGDQLDDDDRDRGVRSAAELPAEVLARLLAEERAVHVDVPRSAYLPRLRALAHRARTGVEETGANTLHLALGSLYWEADGRPLRSPLVLVPVELTTAASGGTYRLTLDESGAGAPNPCLLEKLAQVHGLTVPGMAEPGDGRALDLTTALTAMQQALTAAGLPWRVEATADLAVLPSATSRTWHDLDRNAAQLATSPLVAHLVDRPDTPFADPAPDTAADVDLDELAARCPLPADASQLRAVAEALAGRTFVLEGAPGTGKSQTIANLLTRAVAEGRRVLFVAGKRAALDVVARRLDAVGMGPFALDLHGRGSRPAVVRAQIRAALDHTVAVDGPGLAGDAEELRSATAGLEHYAELLHAPNPAGTSLYSAHLDTLAADPATPPLPVTAAFAARADADVVTAVRRALALLPDIAGLARPSASHAWGFIDTIELDITAVQQAAAAVDTAVRELPGEGGLAGAVRAAGTDEDLDTLVHLLTGPRLGLDVLDEVRSARWRAATDDVAAQIAGLVAAPHPAWEVVTPEALALPLAELREQAGAAADTGWLARRGKLAAVRDRLAPVLQPGAVLRAGDVAELLAELHAVQGAVHALGARAAGIPGLQVPVDWNPFLDSGRFLVDAEVRWLRRAAAAVGGDSRLARALRRALAGGPVADAPAAAPVARLRDAVTHLLAVCSSTPALLAAWTGEEGLVLRWAMTRPERGVEYVHPLSLRRWVSLLDTLEPLRLAGLTEARVLLRHGLVRAEDAVHAFDRGLAEATVAERRAATGLDEFEAGRHEQTIDRFAAASRAVRSHLTAALPAGLLAAREAELRGRVGALERELAEQRSGLGVRGLLAAHGELITTLMPCVLASPDTVARFLPATADLFDLVVFDEASQLRVADAIGALGRARAAVVVGDSRQLPPSSAGEAGGPDTDGSGADADEESILGACLRAGVPRQRLTWHYRSQDETLIAFSNAHYYDGRLATFPAPGRAAGRGISLVRVPGTFLRSGPGLRTNPVEAQAVVDEVLRRFALARPPVPSIGLPVVPSIGVVTFNAAQRTLIEELLRDSGDDRVVDALDRTDGEGLFVKNLENVQGDERDVVLFSTGFSPDAAGRLPLNFGPLNRRGGERRLNVAVTRARRQVVVFSSFTPEQLRAEETASLGVKHLRAYLDLAAHGTDALPGTAHRVAVEDRHRDDVAAELRARGLAVRNDVGLSDFRIDLTVAPASAPDSPVLAVLLDGPGWARRETVGDRDGLPVEVLAELMGWPAVERVWLPTWLADRAAVLDRLASTVAAATPPEPEPEPEPEPDPEPVAEPEPEPVEEPTPEPVADVPPTHVLPRVLPALVQDGPHDGPLAEVIQLRPLALAPVADPAPAAGPDVLPEPESAAEPEPAAGSAVEPVAEPEPEPERELEPEPQPEPIAVRPAPRARQARTTRPVPLDEEQPFIPWAPRPTGQKRQLDRLTDPAVARVVRRVLTAGLKAEGPVHRDRLTRIAAGAFGMTRVTEARRDALLALLPAGVQDGDFLWPAGVDREAWPWFRRQASSVDRPLDQVAPREIGNAMVALCRAAGGLTREELFARTAEVFGHRRRTPALLPLLDAALALAVGGGRLTEQPDGVLSV